MPDYINDLRAKIGTQKLLVPSTACIITNAREEVLLQLRSDTHCWGCPGGIMDIGESSIESVRREVREETGLTVHDPWLFGVYAGPSYQVRYPNGDELAVVQLAFIAEEYAGELATGDESLDLRFYPITDLPDPDSIVPNHREFLMHYRDYLRGRRTVPIVG